MNHVKKLIDKKEGKDVKKFAVKFVLENISFDWICQLPFMFWGGQNISEKW